MFDRIVFNLVNSCNCYYLDENLSYALLSDLWQHVVTYFDIGRVLNCGLVVAMFSSDSNIHHPHLVVLNLVDKSNITYFIINPKSLIISEKSKAASNALVLAILKFARIFDIPTLIDSPTHFVSASGRLNYLILYGLIRDIFEGRQFTTLDINELTRQVVISDLLPDKPIRVNIIDKVNRIQLNIDERRTFINSIIAENLDADSDQWIKIIDSCVVLNKPAKKESKPYLGNKLRGVIDDSIGKWELRQSYTLDRRSSIRKLLNSDNVNQWPPVADIINHFSRSLPALTDWSFEPCIRSGDVEVFMGAITPHEILKILKKTNKSCPGEDGISYTDLKLIDPDCNLLSTFFNTILSSGVIPQSWKHFRTILIPKPGKTGEYGDISNWRPIALLSTSYKLFASVLCHRLMTWVKLNNLIHNSQKSNYEFEGCAQHAFGLTGILEHRKVHNKNLNIAWLDIADAFGSVPHEYLWNLLLKSGLHESFLFVLINLYSGTTSTYSCGDLKTPHINIVMGVKQGCPLSMLLFSLAINPVIETIDTTFGKGYTMNDLNVGVLAYADDLALISENETTLQTMLDNAEKVASWAGLQFRPNKCATLSIPDRVDLAFNINNVDLPKILPSNSYKYLGVPIGIELDQSPHDSLKQAFKDVEIISKSDLFPWQKLDAFKTFVHPRLIFIMRTREIKITNFSDNRLKNSTNLRIDQKLIPIFKSIVSIPRQADNAFLYMPTDLGGAGITSFRSEYNIQTVVQAFNMLACSDITTSYIAHTTLLEVGKARFRSNDIVGSLEFLNGSAVISKNYSFRSWLSGTRTAVLALRKSGVDLTFTFEQNLYKIYINGNSMPTCVITYAERKKLCTLLRKYIQCQKYFELCAGKRSPFMAEAMRFSQVTNKLWLKGWLSLNAWHFYSRAKLNVLPVLALPHCFHRGDDLKCRRCHESEESLSHVLQSCRLNMTMITERHNKALAILVGVLKSKDRIMVVDSVCPFVDLNLRIDLMVIDNRLKTIHLVDMKCPRDSLTNFRSVNQQNLNKYEDLRLEINKVKKDFTVSLHTVIVGALGTVDKKYTMALKLLGVPNKIIDRTIRAMAISNIEESAKIWHYHSTGQMIRYGNRIKPDSAFNLERGLHLPSYNLDDNLAHDQHVPDDRVDTDYMPVFNFSEDGLLSILDHCDSE